MIEEKNNIIELLSDYDMNTKRNSKDIHNSMIVIEGENIIGYGSYIPIKIEDDCIGIIDVILIKNEFRNQYIGDGLIKSLLNLADKKGISKVYALSNKKESLFYKKLGFVKRDKLDEALIKETSLNNIFLEADTEVFEAKLPDFFNKACKSNL